MGVDNIYIQVFLAFIIGAWFPDYGNGFQKLEMYTSQDKERFQVTILWKLLKVRRNSIIAQLHYSSETTALYTVFFN